MEYHNANTFTLYKEYLNKFYKGKNVLFKLEAHAMIRCPKMKYF